MGRQGAPEPLCVWLSQASKLQWTSRSGRYVLIELAARRIGRVATMKSPFKEPDGPPVAVLPSEVATPAS